MRKSIGIALLVAATASAGIEDTILHGVTVGHVKTWVGPGTVSGVTAEQLEADAESGLAKAGIKLDKRSPADLVITVMVWLSDSDSCFVTIQSRLVEPAKLNRNGFTVDAVSWETGGTVVGKAADCSTSTQQGARRAVADFVEHYRAMNPSR